LATPPNSIIKLGITGMITPKPMQSMSMVTKIKPSAGVRVMFVIYYAINSKYRTLAETNISTVATSFKIWRPADSRGGMSASGCRQSPATAPTYGGLQQCLQPLAERTTRSDSQYAINN